MSKFSDSTLPGTTAAKLWNAAALVLGQVAWTVPPVEELLLDELLLDELLLELLLDELDELLLEDDELLLAGVPPHPVKARLVKRTRLTYLLSVNWDFILGTMRNLFLSSHRSSLLFAHRGIVCKNQSNTWGF
jgi:hypothetical protein